MVYGVGGDSLPQWMADSSAGFGDTLSFGLTIGVRKLVGTDPVVDKCSSAYSKGEWSAMGMSVMFGGDHIGRNAYYQMGKRGAFRERLFRGITRIFKDPRRWNTVRHGWSIFAGKGSAWLQRMDKVYIIG